MSDTLARFPTVNRSSGSVPGQQRSAMLIVFLDFTHFNLQSERVDDAEIAEVMDAHYRRVAQAVQTAGGRVIKFIGDATMAVFPEKSVDAAIRAIFDMRLVEDKAMQFRGWGQCRLHARAHFGEVVAAEVGPDGDKRYDVFGKAVNQAAKLKTSGFALSSDAYKRLNPELQRRFKHESAMGTYVAD
jgi:class 3 adenylate cyclase